MREVRATDPNATCIAEFLDENDPNDRALLARALSFPDSIVASDAMPVFLPENAADPLAWPLPPGSATHPRTSGTFARAIRMLVRDTGTWTWAEAFRRCSWLPSRVVARIAPDARAKGHLGVGADADIVVLDPNRFTDNATFTAPTSGVIRRDAPVGQRRVRGARGRTAHRRLPRPPTTRPTRLAVTRTSAPALGRCGRWPRRPTGGNAGDPASREPVWARETKETAIRLCCRAPTARRRAGAP